MPTVDVYFETPAVGCRPSVPATLITDTGNSILLVEFPPAPVLTEDAWNAMSEEDEITELERRSHMWVGRLWISRRRLSPETARAS